jgi:dihydrofolate reductase
MTRTQYYAAASIDGFIADQDDALDWLFEVDPGVNPFDAFFADVGAFALGATSYEWMWRHAEIVKWGESYGDTPCWVFTHRELPPIPDANVTFVRGDVRPVHSAMVGAFADAGLLDELILGVAPVTLGAGAPVLPRRITASRLTLAGVEQIGQFAYLTYAVGPATSESRRVR